MTVCGPTPTSHTFWVATWTAGRAWLNAVALLAVLFFAGAIAPVRADDAADIRRLLATQFDKPNSPLSIDPVVVAHDHAIAGWSQEERGGRALLKWTDGEWRVILCGGDALTDAAALAANGIPPEIAERLANETTAAERLLDPDRRRLLSSFQGVMSVDETQPAPHPRAHH